MTKNDLVREIHARLTGQSDLDWSELAEQRKLCIHPDQLRKIGAGAKQVVDAGMLALDDDASSAQEATVSTFDLQKMKDMRAEINEAYRAEARSEALRDAVYEAAANLPPMKLTIPQRKAAYEDRSLVLAPGDFHFGAEWHVTGLHGEVLNEYSPEIFERRMIDLIEQVI